MSYPYPRITKQLSLTPATVGDSPRAKSYSIAGEVSNLFKFLSIPAFQIGIYDYKYVRQMLGQFNYSFTEDFYILNVSNYKAFASAIIHGGCLCIRWREGTTVYRYKLIDSDDSTDWSYFTPYSNQLIKKNFCIEFWGNILAFGQLRHQLAQDILLQLSSFYEPTVTSETPAVTEISAEDFLNTDELGESIPIDGGIPYSNETVVWLTN